MDEGQGGGVGWMRGMEGQGGGGWMDEGQAEEYRELSKICVFPHDFSVICNLFPRQNLATTGREKVATANRRSTYFCFV